MLFILYWNECHLLDISSCTPYISCLNSRLFGVGFIKQPLRKVKEKNKSPQDTFILAVLSYDSY